jgi:hypothetical protein
MQSALEKAKSKNASTLEKARNLEIINKEAPVSN